MGSSPVGQVLPSQGSVVVKVTLFFVLLSLTTFFISSITFTVAALTSPAALEGIPAFLRTSFITPCVVTLSTFIAPPFNTPLKISSAAALPVETDIGPLWLVRIPPSSVRVSQN